MTREVIQERLNHWKTIYENLAGAMEALSSGGVKYYLINDRQLTYTDIDVISKELQHAERMVDYYTSLLNGGRARKAFSVIPRDW